MDFEHAKWQFSEYLKKFDCKNDKIALKIRHTMGVVDCSEYIAKSLHLSEEDVELAKLIALLHDIGRFVQLERFNSFDDRLMPHAQCSVDLLFQENKIRDFIKECDFDKIIYEAIKYHGVFQMPQDLEGRSLLHTKIIRDADKLDNFYVKENEAIITMLDVTASEAAKEEVTDSIFETILQDKPVLNSDRKTHLDMWVSYIGYIFDLNFSCSCRYVLERHCIENIIARIPYQRAETQRRMSQIQESALRYLARRIGE